MKAAYQDGVSLGDAEMLGRLMLFGQCGGAISSAIVLMRASKAEAIKWRRRGVSPDERQGTVHRVVLAACVELFRAAVLGHQPRRVLSCLSTAKGICSGSS